jgi:hypothetical protein
MESGATTNIPNKSKDEEQKQTKLVDVVVTNPNDALQLIATFLNLAQKRGAFSIDESAKIWECIKVFQVADANANNSTSV